MSLAALAIEKRAVSYFVVFLLVLAGIGAFFSLGQLEDPEFTVKTAVITTLYPGASPRAGRPEISDDFGDVFGFQLAVVGDGFSYADLEEYAKDIKKELSLVKDVARVDLWGVQDKVIYVNVSQSQLSELGLTDASVRATLEQQNMVVDAGGVDLDQKRFRVAPTGEFKSPEDIGNLHIRASLGDEVSNLMTDTSSSVEPGRTDELIRIRDFATVEQGYAEPPQTLMRYNRQPAVGISTTNVSGVNTVKVGERIDKALDEIIPRLPVGIEVHRIHWQSDIVDDAVKGFLINFGEAVAIVLIVLTLAMGWRMGIIIGSSLVLTILASFILMAIFGIDLQRMSLGALVIALGMMVDNAIVVADGIVVRMQQGMDRKQLPSHPYHFWGPPLSRLWHFIRFLHPLKEPENTAVRCLPLWASLWL